MANKPEFRTPSTLAMHEAQKQAAVNVELYVRLEAVKLPTKQAEKLDAVRALVDEEALRLFTLALTAGEQELTAPAAPQAPADEGKTPPPVSLVPEGKPAKAGKASDEDKPAAAGKPGDLPDPFA